MSTNTPRLQLVKPEINDSIGSFDSQAGSAMETVDLNFGARELGALPGTSFIGDVVKDTSTGDYRRWNGAKWQLAGQPNVFADSFESFNDYPNRQDILGGTEHSIAPASTWNVFQTHDYLIRFCGQLEYNVATSGFIQVRIRLQMGGGPVTTASTLLREYRFFVDSTGFFSKAYSGFHVYTHAGATDDGAFGLFAQAETAVDFHVGGGPGSGGTDNVATTLIISSIGG